LPQNKNVPTFTKTQTQGKHQKHNLQNNCITSGTNVK